MFARYAFQRAVANHTVVTKRIVQIYYPVQLQAPWGAAALANPDKRPR